MNCPTGRTSEQLKLITIQNELDECKKELINFTKAYNILMDYFDCIPDEEKEEVSKQLDECEW